MADLGSTQELSFQSGARLVVLRYHGHMLVYHSTSLSPPPSVALSVQWLAS